MQFLPVAIATVICVATSPCRKRSATQTRLRRARLRGNKYITMAGNGAMLPLMTMAMSTYESMAQTEITLKVSTSSSTTNVSSDYQKKMKIWLGALTALIIAASILVLFYYRKRLVEKQRRLKRSTQSRNDASSSPPSSSSSSFVEDMDIESGIEHQNATQESENQRPTFRVEKSWQSSSASVIFVPVYAESLSEDDSEGGGDYWIDEGIDRSEEGMIGATGEESGTVSCEAKENIALSDTAKTDISKNNSSNGDDSVHETDPSTLSDQLNEGNNSVTTEGMIGTTEEEDSALFYAAKDSSAKTDTAKSDISKGRSNGISSLHESDPFILSEQSQSNEVNNSKITEEMICTKEVKIDTESHEAKETSAKIDTAKSGISKNDSSNGNDSLHYLDLSTLSDQLNEENELVTIDGMIVVTDLETSAEISNKCCKGNDSLHELDPSKLSEQSNEVNDTVPAHSVTTVRMIGTTEEKIDTVFYEANENGAKTDTARSGMSKNDIFNGNDSLHEIYPSKHSQQLNESNVSILSSSSDGEYSSFIDFLRAP